VLIDNGRISLQRRNSQLSMIISFSVCHSGFKADNEIFRPSSPRICQPAPKQAGTLFVRVKVFLNKVPHFYFIFKESMPFMDHASATADDGTFNRLPDKLPSKESSDLDIMAVIGYRYYPECISCHRGTSIRSTSQYNLSTHNIQNFELTHEKITRIRIPYI